MLYQGGEMAKPIRLQSAFVTEAEVKKVVKYLADSYESLPKETLMLETESEGLNISLNNEGDDDDEMYPQAKALVIESGRASTSFLQRRLGLGYSRAAKLLDILEERGVVGPANGSKAREVFGKKETDAVTLPENV
jgi:S-DNA-T family DNA segregation ATPase FtsK/SpoIIIE